MRQRTCLLCLRDLPPLRWWTWVFGNPMSVCRSADGEACRAEFFKRMGIKDPRLER